MKLALKTFLAKNALKINLDIKFTNSKKTVDKFITSIRPLQTEIDLVRIGGEKDGGYLVPNDFQGIEGCFSPGVGNSISFEEELAQLGIQSYLVDYSVYELPSKNNKITFERNFLGYSDEPHFITLSQWINKYQPNSNNLILQMDVEGAEYEILQKCTISDLKRFRFMVIEFHSFHKIIYKREFVEIKKSLDRILNEFYVVHAHINNGDESFNWHSDFIPKTLELTFIRKDRVKKVTKHATIPHSLDCKNNHFMPDNPLPNVWKSST